MTITGLYIYSVKILYQDILQNHCNVRYGKNAQNIETEASSFVKFHNENIFAVIAIEKMSLNDLPIGLQSIK